MSTSLVFQCHVSAKGETPLLSLVYIPAYTRSHKSLGLKSYDYKVKDFVLKHEMYYLYNITF